MRFRLGVCLLVLSLAAVAFAGPDKPITNVKSLSGDWRAMGGASAAAIRIKPDGSYEGISANGAKTVGKITTAGGKASFQSANSAGSVTWSGSTARPLRPFTKTESCERLSMTVA